MNLLLSLRRRDEAFATIQYFQKDIPEGNFVLGRVRVGNLEILKVKNQIIVDF